jgi:Raf kinase inhibitor-like YbhB/YbcL family protein
MAATMTLTSPSFASGGEIPRKHTCEGEGVSPALVWSGVPSTARTLVLIVDDPDAPDPAAPRTTFVHWVVYNLPSAVSGLPEAAEAAVLPPGARVGTNDWRHTAYGGPCPPIGRHRYFFKLYALDVALPDGGAANKASVVEAMRGHVVAEAELVGTYQKHQ